LSIAFNRPCWSKSRVNSKILCSVCYTYQPCPLFSTNYCCSSVTKHVTRQICDLCVHQYITSILSSCITSSISCPEFNCRANLSETVICHILLKYEDDVILNDYLREQQWQGKNEEWIKRFTLRCPGCNIPIEKNGGCDEMICSQCQIHFYWSKASRYNESIKKLKQKSFFVTDVIPNWMRFAGIVLVILFLFFIFYEK
jgi:hypothetical protein